MVEALDRLIAGGGRRRRLARAALEADGLTIHTGARATGVHHDGHRFAVTLENNQVVPGERVLVAVGRRAEIGPLGVETVGLDPDARAIEVDGRMRAGERLWAIGDVTVHGGFTHVAMYQAGVAVRDILGTGGHRPTTEPYPGDVHGPGNWCGRAHPGAGA